MEYDFYILAVPQHDPHGSGRSRRARGASSHRKLASTAPRWSSRSMSLRSPSRRKSALTGTKNRQLALDVITGEDFPAGRGHSDWACSAATHSLWRPNEPGNDPLPPIGARWRSTRRRARRRRNRLKQALLLLANGFGKGTRTRQARPLQSRWVSVVQRILQKALLLLYRRLANGKQVNERSKGICRYG